LHSIKYIYFSRHHLSYTKTNKLFVSIILKKRGSYFVDWGLVLL
jgi:hypothetical protein